MIGEKIIERKPVALAEVKELLKERKGEKDLSYEQDLTLKYAKKFSKTNISQSGKLNSELVKIDGLDSETIVKIVDLLPVTKERLQLLIPKEIVLDQASMDKILELCKKFKK